MIPAMTIAATGALVSTRNARRNRNPEASSLPQDRMWRAGEQTGISSLSFDLAGNPRSYDSAGIQVISAALHSAYSSLEADGVADAVGTNEYLHMIRDPFNCNKVVPVPDMEQFSTTTKSIHYNKTFSAGPSGNPSGDATPLFLCWNYLSQKPTLSVFRKSTADGNFYPSEVIKPDYDLGTGYKWGRPIAGGLEFYSSTIAAGQFAVNGQITAVHLNDVPDLRTVTSSTIISYTSEGCGIATGVNDGIVCISPPSVREINVLDTTNTTTYDDIYTLNYELQNLLTNNVGGVPGVCLMHDSMGNLPYNVYGGQKVIFHVSALFKKTTAITEDVVHSALNFIFRSTNPDGTTTDVVSSVTQYGVIGTNTALGDVLVAQYSGTMVSPEVGTLVAVSITGDINHYYYELHHCRVNMQFPELYNSYYNLPIHLVYLDGTQNSQQFKIFLRQIWEVVPNAILARDVKTRELSGSPHDLVLAKMHFFDDPRLIFSRSFYKAEQFYFRDVCCNRAVQAYQAANLVKRIGRFFRNRMGPILPQMGGLIGGAMGNAHIGTLVGGLAQQLVNKIPTATRLRAAALNSLNDNYLASSCIDIEEELKEIETLYLPSVYHCASMEDLQSELDAIASMSFTDTPVLNTEVDMTHRGHTLDYGFKLHPNVITSDALVLTRPAECLLEMPKKLEAKHFNIDETGVVNLPRDEGDLRWLNHLISPQMFPAIDAHGDMQIMVLCVSMLPFDGGLYVKYGPGHCNKNLDAREQAVFEAVFTRYFAVQAAFYVTFFTYKSKTQTTLGSNYQSRVSLVNDGVDGDSYQVAMALAAAECNVSMIVTGALKEDLSMSNVGKLSEKCKGSMQSGIPIMVCVGPSLTKALLNKLVDLNQDVGTVQLWALNTPEKPLPHFSFADNLSDALLYGVVHRVTRFNKGTKSHMPSPEKILQHAVGTPKTWGFLKSPQKQSNFAFSDDEVCRTMFGFTRPKAQKTIDNMGPEINGYKMTGDSPIASQFSIKLGDPEDRTIPGQTIIYQPGSITYLQEAFLRKYYKDQLYVHPNSLANEVAQGQNRKVREVKPKGNDHIKPIQENSARYRKLTAAYRKHLGQIDENGVLLVPRSELAFPPVTWKPTGVGASNGTVKSSPKEITVTSNTTKATIKPQNNKNDLVISHKEVFTSDDFFGLE